jgi:hypothetical protein
VCRPSQSSEAELEHLFAKSGHPDLVLPWQAEGLSLMHGHLPTFRAVFFPPLPNGGFSIPLAGLFDCCDRDLRKLGCAISQQFGSSRAGGCKGSIFNRLHWSLVCTSHWQVVGMPVTTGKTT